MPINYTVLRRLDPNILDEIRRDFIARYKDEVVVHEITPRAKAFIISIRTDTGKWEKFPTKTSDTVSPFLEKFFQLQRIYLENKETEKYRHMSLVRFRHKIMSAILSSPELQDEDIVLRVNGRPVAR